MPSASLIRIWRVSAKVVGPRTSPSTVTTGLSAFVSATVTSAPRLKRAIRFWMSVATWSVVLPPAGTSPTSWIVIMPSGRTTTFSTTAGSGRIVTASVSGGPIR